MTDLFCYDTSVLSECFHPEAKKKSRLSVPMVFFALTELDLDDPFRKHVQTRLFHYFEMRGMQLLLSRDLSINFTKIYLDYIEEMKNFFG